MKNYNGQPLGVSGNKYHLGIASLLSQGGAGSNPAAAQKNNFKKILKKVLHFGEKYLILTTQNKKAMSTFSFQILKTIKFKNVTIDLYNSTEGYFVETSEGLVSEYFNTKKEAIYYIKNVKSNIE